MADEIKMVTIKEEGEIGVVKIADEVLATIVGLAATEVQGVSALAGNATNDLIAKKGGKALSKGVKVQTDGQDITVDVAVRVDFGVSIPAVSKAVQERVKAAIENMTGMNVLKVNVDVADVAMEEE